MRYNVAQLLMDHVGAVRKYDIDEEPEDIGDIVFTGPISGEVKLTRTNRGIEVDAKIASNVRLTCSRCLTEFDFPLKVSISEEFQPTIDVSTGRPLPPLDDESIFSIDENHVLDLTEAIRQYTILALPIQPLCRLDCPGLCSQCGQNLNEGKCECPEHTPSEHMSALAALLEEKFDKE